MAIAVVTGASSGLGADFAKQLSENKDISEIWLIARRRNRLEELAAALKIPAKIICADLSTEEGLHCYKDLLIAEKPKIMYLVNAAGYGLYGNYKVVDTKKAFNMIDLNVKALVYITQESIPHLVKGGHIIQMGSASTYNPLPNLNVYASTKSFVKHYSRAIAYELKPLEISVTTVCPGWVKTEFFDRAKIDADSDHSFAKPMVRSADVVKKAIKDADHGKQVSMYALFNKTHHLLSKLLPHRLIIAIWNSMQK